MWKYGYEDATSYRAKQSVTEIKRNYQSEEGSDNAFIKNVRQLKHVRALWRKRINVRRAWNSSPCRYAAC